MLGTNRADQIIIKLNPDKRRKLNFVVNPIVTTLKKTKGNLWKEQLMRPHPLINRKTGKTGYKKNRQNTDHDNPLYSTSLDVCLICNQHFSVSHISTYCRNYCQTRLSSKCAFYIIFVSKKYYAVCFSPHMR